MNVPLLTAQKASETPPYLGPAHEEQADRLLAILTLAFAADPPCRWMYPDPVQYLRDFPKFARVFGGKALAQGTALLGDHAAALWLPPGVEPDEAALAALVEESVSAEARANVFALFGEMARYHPSEPHWYLPMIGVEPAWQGQGHGVALIEPVLAQCDTAGLPAYLEATSPHSRPFYERLGFEALGLIEVGGCPPLVAMWRRPVVGRSVQHHRKRTEAGCG